jgi:molybdenum cofactor cytidylyltransferase
LVLVSGILLAAGASSRFGSPKMLSPVPPDGRLLLARVIETWREAGIDDLLIVLGCGADAIRDALEENLLRRVRWDEPAGASVRFVASPNWENGMFSSVKAGLAAVGPDSTHFAISPADLPFLSKESLRRVLHEAALVDQNSVVVPTHARRRGHPLVIPAALRSRILSWPDTDRLSRVFDEPDVRVLHLEGFDDAILRDVDRPQDLARVP